MTDMKYSIDLKKNIIYCEYSGNIKASAMIVHIMSIRNDPDFHNNLNTISDIRKATFPTGFMEMNKIAEYVKSTSHFRKNFKLAIITSQLNMNSADIYKTLSDDGYVKLCNNIEEAENWIFNKFENN